MYSTIRKYGFGYCSNVYTPKMHLSRRITKTPLVVIDIIDSRLFRCSPTAPAPSRESSAPAPSYGESP